MPSYVTDFLRNNGGDIFLTNCYGGYTASQYGINNDWNKLTNYITETPQVNQKYRITEDENLWKNVGTGTNPDGTKAHIGIYGGEYSWEY